MKKKGVTILLGIIALALVTLNGFVYLNADHTGPVIHLPSSNSEYARNVDAKTLLNGVSATDNRDGDVSSTLRVASIVPNSDDTKASVVYTAKDKSNNVTKLTRTITYSAETGAAADGNAAAANPNPSAPTTPDAAAPATPDAAAATTPDAAAATAPDNTAPQSTATEGTDSVPAVEAEPSANNE